MSNPPASSSTSRFDSSEKIIQDFSDPLEDDSTSMDQSQKDLLFSTDHLDHPISATDLAFHFNLDSIPMESFSESYGSLINSGNESESSIPIDSLFDEIQRMNPCGPPKVGHVFMGFDLIEQIGKGSFAGVYLARQPELSNRLVVLKVSKSGHHESQLLARLQHTNIVPILSVHVNDEYHAICMPYLGKISLADTLKHLRHSTPAPTKGINVLSAVPSVRKYLEYQSTMRFSDLSFSESGKLNHSSINEVSQSSHTEIEKHIPESMTLLQKMNYEFGVFWLAKGLAEGLTHAHERGILHLDLKPSNILLTDDGQPMLFDFNLSVDRSIQTQDSYQNLGGTIPYMAPEHLESLLDHTISVDERSDIYSMGIVLFELLTYKIPFLFKTDSGLWKKENIQKIIDQRKSSPPDIRLVNRKISKTASSIVKKCLEPYPGDRYQNATQLSEDLWRYLNHMPLRYAPDPSLWERSKKWVRRHPALTTALTILFIGLTASGIAGIEYLKEVEKNRQLAANQFNENITLELQNINSDLMLAISDREQSNLLIQRITPFIEKYDLESTSSFQSRMEFDYLEPIPKNEILRSISEMYLMLASLVNMTNLGAIENQRDISIDYQTDTRRYLELSKDWNPKPNPGYFWNRQRWILARIQNNQADVDRYFHAMNESRELDLRESYLSVVENIAGRKYDLAQEKIEMILDANPDDFITLFLKGKLYAQKNDPGRAISSFSQVIGLAPWFANAYRERAFLFQYLEKDYDYAIKDLNDAIALRPDYSEALLDRAELKIRLKDFSGAIADYQALITINGNIEPFVHMLEIAEQMEKDPESSNRLLIESNPLQSDDIRFLTKHGWDISDNSPEESIAYFEKVLKINPQFKPALIIYSQVLTEKLERYRNGEEIANLLVTYYPEDEMGYLLRAYAAAYNGDLTVSKSDAQWLLDIKNQLNTDEQTKLLFQISCIYGILALKYEEELETGFDLLKQVITRGYSKSKIFTEKRWKPWKNHPEFLELMKLKPADGPPKTTGDA